MKKQSKTLILRKETLRHLDGSELKEAAGGGRLRVPVGFADDTSPVYAWVDDTNG
jgi:hypothetical protein